MTASRFRSTAQFAPIERAPTVHVERATFVVFSIGGFRFAVSADSCERVLRADTGGHAISYEGRAVPRVDLAFALGLSLRPSLDSRVLVLNDGQAWRAADVDGVHEVVTIDVATIASTDTGGNFGYRPVGALGIISRSGHSIFVIDIARVLSADVDFDMLVSDDLIDIHPPQSYAQ